MTAQWLGIFVTYMLLAGEGSGLLGRMPALLGVYMAINVARRHRRRAQMAGARAHQARPLPALGRLLFPLVARAAASAADAYEMAPGLADDAAATCGSWARGSAATR